MHHGHSTFMLPSCAISGECSTCEGYLPCSEPYLNPLSPYTNFALMDCLSLSHFRAWLYVHFFSLKLWFTDHLSRLHTPTTLYGVSVLSSLESYGHIVLGHPQLSCRIENLSYSGLLVAQSPPSSSSLQLTRRKVFQPCRSPLIRFVWC